MKLNGLTLFLPIAVALTISFSACNETTGSAEKTSADSTSITEEKTPLDNASITGTLAGQISHNELNMSDKASCTFDRFPWTVEKFQELQAQVSTEPQGAVTHGIDCYGNLPQISRYW